MPIRSLLVTYMVLVLAGCGSGSGGSEESDEEDATAAAMPAPMPDGGSGAALHITPRTYTGGNVTAKISGFFAVDGSQDLNKPASITDDGSTWIQYGVSGAQELNVLFTNNESMAENGLNIGVGPYTVTATSTSGECKTHFDVQAATVSGHYSCTGSTGYDKSSGQMGKVDIEVDFNAGS